MHSLLNACTKEQILLNKNNNVKIMYMKSFMFGVLYCKSGNFRSTLIFALFAQNFTNAKIKTRQYVSLVQRSMGVNSAP